MTAKTDAPLWLLDWFRLTTDTKHVAGRLEHARRPPLRWATREQLREEPPRSPRKRIPFGELVGGRPVHGRGSLVTCSGRYLLRTDIEAALADGGRWPWEGGPEVLGAPSADDPDATDIVRRTWSLDGDDNLVWRREPHYTKPAGSVVDGTALSGRSDRVVFTLGTYYLAADVRHVLAHGRWPWQPDWD